MRQPHEQILNLAQLRSSDWVQRFRTAYTYPKISGEDLLNAAIEQRKVLVKAAAEKSRDKKGKNKQKSSASGGSTGAGGPGKRKRPVNEQETSTHAVTDGATLEGALLNTSGEFGPKVEVLQDSPKDTGYSFSHSSNRAIEFLSLAASVTLTVSAGHRKPIRIHLPNNNVCRESELCDSLPGIPRNAKREREPPHRS